MPRTLTLSILALLALLLAACKPEPASLVFELDNTADPTLCPVALRAELTLPYGEPPSRLSATPGAQDAAYLSVPHQHEGDPVTLEAWCDTGQDESDGYARVDGVLPRFYPATFIQIYPPRDSGACLTPTQSAGAAPCITGHFVKPAAATASP